MIPNRTGLRIRGNRGNKEVRQALIRYARWLRSKYEFPIRLPVYLSPHKFAVMPDDRECSAGFFAPLDRNTEPLIRIYTGDYTELKKDIGREGALAHFVVSLSHELLHYQQWRATGDAWERGVAARAVRMLRQYEKEVDRL